MPPALGRLKVVTWNIQALAKTAISTGERLSGLKRTRSTTAANDLGSKADVIAQLLFDMDFDIAVIVELRRTSHIRILQRIETLLNGKDPNLNFAAFLSEDTGWEAYGFIVRNAPGILGHNHIRPVFRVPGGTAPVLSHDLEQYFSDDGVSRPANLKFDIVDLHNCEIRNRDGDVVDDSITSLQGEPQDYLRHPALGLFLVLGPGGAHARLIPIVAIHTKSGGIGPTKSQIHRIKALDIAQKYMNGGSLTIDHVAFTVQDLIITGDFNADSFNNPAQRTWYDHLVSNNPDTRPHGVAPLAQDIFSFPSLNLRPANPLNGTKTHLLPLLVQRFRENADPNYTLNDLTNSLLDNIFYGGPNLAPAGPGPHTPVDDVTQRVYVQTSQPNGVNFYNLINYGLNTSSFILLQPAGGNNSKEKFNLNQQNPVPDTNFYKTERTGAIRIVSDHLPVTMEFSVT